MVMVSLLIDSPTLVQFMSIPSRSSVTVKTVKTDVSSELSILLTSICDSVLLIFNGRVTLRLEEFDKTTVLLVTVHSKNLLFVLHVKLIEGSPGHTDTISEGTNENVESATVPF